MAEKCTNTSGPPPSWLMNPKPLSALNHFTVPCAIVLSCQAKICGTQTRSRLGLAAPHRLPTAVTVNSRDKANHLPKNLGNASKPWADFLVDRAVRGRPIGRRPAG